MTESLTEKKPLAGNNVINQLAFVVRDIEQASEAFAKLLGIPKPNWFLTGNSEVSKVIFRGQPSDSRSQPSDSRSKLLFMNTVIKKEVSSRSCAELTSFCRII
jgi:hypothetical protein